MEETKRSTMIQIDIDTAKYLAELYNSAKLADTHFKSCQSVQFRQYVSSVIKATNVSNAFSRLNDMIKLGG